MRSGNWLFGDKDEFEAVVVKNIHFTLYFKVNNDRTQSSIVMMHFHNPSFGKFELLKGPEFQQKLDRLAPGFIGRYQHDEESWMSLWKSLSKRRLLIKLLRDDQKTCCSGIGNYLIAEIFYQARLHPKVKLSDLSEDDWLSLFHTIREIVMGHYEGVREKVIYKKSQTPLGFEVVNENVSGRTMWWSPEEQLLES